MNSDDEKIVKDAIRSARLMVARTRDHLARQPKPDMDVILVLAQAESELNAAMAVFYRKRHSTELFPYLWAWLKQGIRK